MLAEILAMASHLPAVLADCSAIESGEKKRLKIALSLSMAQNDAANFVSVFCGAYIMKNRRRVTTICAAFAVTLMVAQSSQAQVVPFKASGTDAVYDTSTAETYGIGNATHMGKTFGSGLAVPIPNTNQWVALGYKFVAANGDEIAFSGGGTIDFFPLPDGRFYAVWSGEFEIVPGSGTGRFANVGPGSAPLTVEAVNDPFELQADGTPLPGAIWTYSWSLTGDIDLGRKGKK